jgi:hypothetical protein
MTKNARHYGIKVSSQIRWLDPWGGRSALHVAKER